MSETQEQQIKDILIQKVTDIKELRNTEGNQKEQIINARQESERAIRAVLTETQIAILDSLKEEKKAQRKAQKEKAKKFGKETVRPAVKAERTAFDSKLSAEEKAIILETKQLLKEMRADLQTEEGQALSNEDRRAKRQEILKKLDPIIDNHSEELEQVEQKLEPLKDQQRSILLEHKNKKPAKSAIGKKFKYKFLLMRV
ncbi:MAG: hypothetical protein JXR19_08355 [Bacteroidia bacterium]